MKKYIPIDFDEKGKVILGNAKNTPTSNGFIPTTWAPGGSDEGKQGLKSISISPAITTTPALDSLFPIYWEDLTEEQKQDGIMLTVYADIDDGAQYTFTITPTADFYAASFDGGALEFGEKGEPITLTKTMTTGQSYDVMFGAANGTSMEASTETVLVTLHVVATIPDGE